VTFLHQLAEDADTVSLVCGATKGELVAEPFVARRQPPEGLAHAHAVAARYGLTHDDVLAQVAR
jgi:hypothetical protein